MRGRPAIRRATRLVAVVVALALPAIASATLWVDQNGEGESDFKVKNGALHRKTFAHIVAPSNFYCNTSNLEVKAAKIPVTDGKIDFVGKAYADINRHPGLLGKLTWKGTLKKGTIRFKTKKTTSYRSPGPDTVVDKPCDTGKLHYTTRPSG
ncbi:MAG: hypothetical protein QOG86_971 [Thermoleophilaceae bacterium]|nr:hypothetical protein [Thermoleophilaceae bacterium]